MKKNKDNATPPPDIDQTDQPKAKTADDQAKEDLIRFADPAWADWRN